MSGWASIAYDEAAERTVVISSDQLAAYDATRDRWEILADVDPVEEWWPHDMVYDPVNRRLVGSRLGRHRRRLRPGDPRVDRAARAERRAAYAVSRLSPLTVGWYGAFGP